MARSAARLLQGGPIATEIRASVKADVATFRRRQAYAPTLAVVIVGKDAPSMVYLQQILRSCRNVGIQGRMVEIPGRVSAAQIRRQISQLNEDPLVSGIIVQMPLPKRIPLAAVIETLDPAKDIDGIHPLNAGLMTLGYEGFLPTTAQAAVEIMKRSGIEIAGKHAVVVGRSNVVGKPASILLLRENATVTVCHSRTRDLAHHLKSAEIVVVAAGKPGLVTGSMLRRGAVVVDVGINVVGDRIVGDVDFESARMVASAITPVPGGVGPVTNALLLTHLLRAARAQVEAPSARQLSPARPFRGVALGEPATPATPAAAEGSRARRSTAGQKAAGAAAGGNARASSSRHAASTSTTTNSTSTTSNTSGAESVSRTAAASPH